MKKLMSSNTAARTLGVTITTLKHWVETQEILPIGKLVDGDRLVFDSATVGATAKRLRPHKPFRSRLQDKATVTKQP